eukprot:14152-Heterococcus_DN1.PRE.6
MEYKLRASRYNPQISRHPPQTVLEQLQEHGSSCASAQVQQKLVFASSFIEQCTCCATNKCVQSSRWMRENATKKNASASFAPTLPR